MPTAVSCSSTSATRSRRCSTRRWRNRGTRPQAVQAALEMRRRLAEWSADCEAMGRPRFRHGIGIHTCEALAGTIGSPDRLSYALVGDAVNLPSWLQDLIKEIKTDIVVSAATKRRLADDVETVPCHAVRVKGKSAEVEVFRVP